MRVKILEAGNYSGVITDAVLELGCYRRDIKMGILQVGY